MGDININDWVKFEPDGNNLYITWGSKRFKLWDIRIDEDYTFGVPTYNAAICKWQPSREVIRANLIITMYSEPSPPKPKRRKQTELGLRKPR